MSVGRQRVVVNAGPGRGLRRRLGAASRGRPRRIRRSRWTGARRRASRRRARRPHLRRAAGRRAGARLGPPGAGRDRPVAARDPGRLRREPRAAAGAAALRRRPRPGGARRGHPDRRRRPRPRPVRPRWRAAGGSASRCASTCIRPSRAELDDGRAGRRADAALGRDLAVPRRRRRGRAGGLGLFRPAAAGAAADARRWLSAPRWSSISARSPGPSAASPRRPPRR